MPPEPLPPWDRFKERRHDRPPPPDALGPPSARWRDSGYHGPGRDFDPRRPPGPARQGNYHLFPEESGSGGGYAWTRWGNRGVADDEFYRPSISRYGRSGYNRENKGSFGGSGSKEWKSHHHQNNHHYQHHYHQQPWELSLPQQQDDGRTQRPGDEDRHVEMTSYQLSSHPPQSDVKNTPKGEQPQLKEDQPEKMPNGNDEVPAGGQPDKMPKGNDGVPAGGQPDKMTNGNDESPVNDRVGSKDHSLGSIAWKPLKWSRSGSLSSRGSGSFTLSEESKLEVQPGKTPARSASVGDPATRTLNVLEQPDETCCRKKQRLGWGEGLAKYEKKKVEGPEDNACGKESKGVQDTSSVSDRSPKTGLPECTSPSPATPSSVACSSSLGFEDKSCNKVSNNDTDACQYSPGNVFASCTQDYSVPENFGLDPVNNISSLLVDLLQADDANCGDSNFVRPSALNKLLHVKNNILKAVEKTEGEIDSFENELKNLESKREAAFTSLIAVDSTQIMKPCDQQLDSAKILEKDSADILATERETDEGSTAASISSSDKQLLTDTRISSSELCQNEQSTEPVADTAPVSTRMCIHEGSDNPSNLSALNFCDVADSSILAAEILVSNKEHAEKSMEVFDRAIPSSLPKIDIWKADKCTDTLNENLVKEKLAMRKSCQVTKEKVLSLKFRAFHHLWKEDVRLLALRKCRPKSQKRCDLNYRSVHSSNQKHRSLTRSRVTSPVNRSTLAPTAEIVEFTGKLLSDSQIKVYRDNLKMPALILDDRERMGSRFVTGNGLVEDPLAVEKEKALMNPWTPEEKEVFMEMLATFGKDFAKIASFLTHKTTADCIEFYYKNHKSDSFEKIKKRLELRKQGQSLSANKFLEVTSKKSWSRGANDVPLDVLGAVSVVTMRSRKSLSGGGNYYDLNGVALEKTTGDADADIRETDSEAVAADVLAGICGGLSSEAMSSCITNSVEPGEGLQSKKLLRLKTGQSLAPAILHNVDEEDTCSDDSSEELDSVDWTDEEKSTFIMALRTYGKDFVSISRCVGTRSRDQCKIFFSKARKCLGLDVIRAGPEGTPTSDANGGRCDSDEDACVAEMGSAICSTQSCSKVEVELTDGTSKGFGHDPPVLLQVELDRISQKDEAGGSNLKDVDYGIDKFLVHNDHEVGTKLNFDSNGESKLPKGEAHSEISTDFLKFSGAEARDSRGFVCDSYAQVDKKTEGQLDQNHEVGQKILSPKAVPNGGKDDNAGEENTCNSASGTSGRDSNVEDSHLSHRVKGSDGSFFTFPVPNCHQEVAVDQASSSKKHQVISWQLKENCSKQSDAKSLQSSSAQYENNIHQARVTAIALEEHKNEKQGPFRPDISLKQVDGQIQILSGYPLQLLNNKEMNGVNVGGAHFVLQNFPNSDLNAQPSVSSQPDICQETCKGLKLPLQNLSSTGFSLIPKTEELDDSLRSYSKTVDNAEELTCKSGDVKLFGQILSQQKPLERRNDNASAPAQNLSRSASLMFSSDRKLDGISATSKKPETCRILEGVEEFPMTSYGYWDGNRIQTGLSRLPDSAMLAVTDYHQVRRVYPVTREILSSSNGSARDAYNLYRSSYERTSVKPFSMVDMKLQERMLPEWQKQRNGYEATAESLGYQQGMVGMNVLGGGMLVGGGCTGVSEPLAAITMHYAAANAASSGVVREDDSWRGDVGR